MGQGHRRATQIAVATAEQPVREPPKLVSAITFLAASRLCAQSSSIVADAVIEDFAETLTMSHAGNNDSSANSGLINKDGKSYGHWLVGRSTARHVPMGLCRTGGSGGRPTLIQRLGSGKCWPLARALAGRTSRLPRHRGQTKMNRLIYDKRHDDEHSL